MALLDNVIYSRVPTDSFQGSVVAVAESSWSTSEQDIFYVLIENGKIFVVTSDDMVYSDILFDKRVANSQSTALGLAVLPHVGHTPRTKKDFLCVAWSGMHNFLVSGATNIVGVRMWIVEVDLSHLSDISFSLAPPIVNIPRFNTHRNTVYVPSELLVIGQCSLERTFNSEGWVHYAFRTPSKAFDFVCVAKVKVGTNTKIDILSNENWQRWKTMSDEEPQLVSVGLRYSENRLQPTLFRFEHILHQKSFPWQKLTVYQSYYPDRDDYYQIIEYANKRSGTNIRTLAIFGYTFPMQSNAWAVKEGEMPFHRWSNIGVYMFDPEQLPKTNMLSPADGLCRKDLAINDIPNFMKFGGLVDYGLLDTSGLVTWMTFKKYGLVIYNVFANKYFFVDFSGDTATLRTRSSSLVRPTTFRGVAMTTAENYQRPFRRVRRRMPTLWAITKVKLANGQRREQLVFVKNIQAYPQFNVSQFKMFPDVFVHWLSERRLPGTFVSAVDETQDFKVVSRSSERTLDTRDDEAVFTALALGYVRDFALGTPEGKDDENKPAHVLARLLDFLSQVDPAEGFVARFLSALENSIQDETVSEKDGAKAFRLAIADVREYLGICRDGVDVVDPFGQQYLATKKDFDIMYVIVGEPRVQEEGGVQFECYDRQTFLAGNEQRYGQSTLLVGARTIELAEGAEKDVIVTRIKTARKRSIFVFTETNGKFTLSEVFQRSGFIMQMFEENARLRQEAKRSREEKADTNPRANKQPRNQTAVPSQAVIPIAHSDTNAFLSKEEFLNAL